MGGPGGGGASGIARVPGRDAIRERCVSGRDSTRWTARHVWQVTMAPEQAKRNLT